jgi:hypothetical protein
MKLGQMEFKPYAAKKPLSIDPTGKFLTASDFLATPKLATETATLSKEKQIKLAVERYHLEPEFKLGVLGMGVLTKEEVIQHLKDQTDFGKVALRAEMDYCKELIASLGTAPTAWPELPKPTVEKLPDWKTEKTSLWIRVPTHALFCENTMDGVTTPIAKWRIDNVHPFFKKRGFMVIPLTGDKDVRPEFVKYAKNNLTVFVGGVGHGSYTCYTGYKNQPILEVGKYDPVEVKDKVLHFLSCETGAKLGPDTIAKGAKDYAGYTENFVFVWDDATTPVNEFLLFVKADSTYDFMTAFGATAGQAYNTTLFAFDAAKTQVPNTAAATWLKYDHDHFKLHGAVATTILPYRWVKVGFPLSLEAENALVAAGELAA